MKRILLLTSLFICFIYFLLVFEHPLKPSISRVEEDEKYDNPNMFAEIHRAMRTPIGSSETGYKSDNQILELNKALNALKLRNRASRVMGNNGVLEWTERGPSNFPGRVRGIIVDYNDKTNQTWFVGSASGGVWKTADGGASWRWLTPQIANLATPTLAMAKSNYNTIYAGLGEGFAGTGRVNGSGLMRSTDHGETWSFIENTKDFKAVNRIIINPKDEKNVLVASDSGVFLTVDAAITWEFVYHGKVQDLRYVPENFNIQYAGVNTIGVIKSIDGGQTWVNKFPDNIDSFSRVEVAISPQNSQHIFASVYGNVYTTDFIYSLNGGENWLLSDITIGSKTLDYLQNQGYYDNTVEADPYDPNVVFVGGIGLYRLEINPEAVLTQNPIYKFINTTDFITLINADFNQDDGRLGVEDVDAKIKVEIRFGKDPTNGTILKQKAHRFLVPAGRTSGVSDLSYTYQDYVDVPFQVWNVSANPPVQLMVSFRDQGRDGVFNLIETNTDADANSQSREYIFIHNINYSSTPDSYIKSPFLGGVAKDELYSFWPVLAESKVWDSNNLPDSKMVIDYNFVDSAPVTATSISDPYGEYDSKNDYSYKGTLPSSSGPHPDHHNIVIIPESQTDKTFRLLISCDGGVFLTKPAKKPGSSQGDFSNPVIGLNNTQFYGVAKCPGKELFIGGSQDNNTVLSNELPPSTKTTKYLSVISGDGFETLWNNYNPNLIIGSAQFGYFERSTDGGKSWQYANKGLGQRDGFPFLTRISNSVLNPNRIYTVARMGVYYSNDFGANWNLTRITESWTSTTDFFDVEVSKANPNIVWAGIAMSISNKIHVSTDAGVTFGVTNNFEGIKGNITNISTHPTEPQTAFAIFALPGSPKILRTNDLGKTWSDISGFGTNKVSSNGFPDVATYCVFVRPDNTNIIWAGTEIGIVESLDNGNTWNILPNDEFPNVSVWQISSMDNFIVVATHGRGIWTAKVEKDLTFPGATPPKLADMGTGPTNNFSLLIKYSQVYDSTIVMSNDSRVQKFNANTMGDNVLTLDNLQKGMQDIYVISYKNGIPAYSNSLQRDNFTANKVVEQYYNGFTNNSDISSSDFKVELFSNQNHALQTDHPYSADENIIASLKQPIIVSQSKTNFDYSDIAIVEPKSLTSAVFGDVAFNDYVIVEGSKDGAVWVPISTGYNADYDSKWLRAYNAGNAVTGSLFKRHYLELTPTFSPNDKIVIRFRLKSNDAIQGWGWVIDDLAIQRDPLEVEPQVVSNLSLSPNPSNGHSMLQYTLTSASSVQLEVYSISGQLEMRYTWNNQEGKYEENINLTSLPDGLYLVRISTAQSNKTVKVILKKE